MRPSGRRAARIPVKTDHLSLYGLTSRYNPIFTLQSQVLSLGSKRILIAKEPRPTRHARQPEKGQSVFAQSKAENKILAGLPGGDFALLKPDLEPVELPLRRRLELRGRRI